MENKTKELFMKPVFKVVAGIIVGVLILWGLTFFGLFTDRQTQKYQEETRAQTYDKSRQYNQGINRDIARYCYQLKTADNDAARKATEGLIRSTMSTYEGSLTPDNDACVKGL